jgi:Carboxypeptidase regulatory-like domain
MSHEHIRPTRTGAWSTIVPTGTAKMEIPVSRAHMSDGSSSMIRLRDGGVWLCSAALVLGAAACGSSPGSATAPSSAGVLVEGIVRGEAPPNSRSLLPPPALAGADVIVISGSATGTSTTTDPNGEYRLQLPRGLFKLRWSKPGYLPMDSAEGIVSTEAITMSDVVLRTAPWTIAGLISDGHGTPVAGATVIVGGSTVLTNFATLTTDGDGGYRFTSAEPHFSTVTIFARKDGYESGETKSVACCATAGDTRFDVRLRRIVGITIDGPGTLAVGEGAALPINDITLDDGSHRFIYLLPTSDDPSVVAVERAFMGQQGYGVRGIRPGAATVRCDWENFAVQLQVRVVDR